MREKCSACGYYYVDLYEGYIQTLVNLYRSQERKLSSQHWHRSGTFSCPTGAEIVICLNSPIEATATEWRHYGAAEQARH